jgi:hypothetical protein
VIADKNRYQYQPATAAGSICIAGVGKVDIYLKSRQMPPWRLYGNNKWQLEPDHYLNLLKERPMAFNRPDRYSSGEQWPDALEKLPRFC